MRRVFLIIWLIGLSLFLPFGIKGQSILWEKRYNNGADNEYIEDVISLKNGDILGVGDYSFPPGKKRVILKFDSIGNLLWTREPVIDSFIHGFIYFIEPIPNEENFIIGGFAQDLWNNDFLAKIDTAGDTLWTRKYSYLTFYGTIKSAIVLIDKSIITTGNILTPTSFDFTARRVDSLGNLMWERIYSMTGDNRAYDVIDMMDGSLILAGSNQGSIALIRTDFDGNTLALHTIPILQGSLGSTKPISMSLMPDHSLTIGVFTISGSNILGQYCKIGPDLNQINLNQFANGGVLWSPQLLEDSTFFTQEYVSNDTSILSISSINLNQKFWSLPYGSFSSNKKNGSALDYLGGDDWLIGGSMDTLNNGDYWIAKIGAVGKPWVADPCVISPMNPGFSWTYDVGILICNDTSFSGLIYHDSIYSYEWFSSTGFSSDSSKLYALWDTANEPTIDVTLIIENFYRCKDTITVTLQKYVNGIGSFVQDEIDINLFPNPARSQLNIEINSKAYKPIKGRITLLDINGREVLSQELNMSKESLDLTLFSPSIYFAKIEVNGVVEYRKVIKR